MGHIQLGGSIAEALVPGCCFETAQLIEWRQFSGHSALRLDFLTNNNRNCRLSCLKARAYADQRKQGRRPMQDGNFKTTGGCLCQSVLYEADHLPTATGYCHCRMCQRALGNTFGTWAAFRIEGFRYTEKDPRWHRSSDIASRCFCSSCGSPIAYLPDGSEEIYVWLGTLDNAVSFRPEKHYHIESRIPWADQQSDLPVVVTTDKYDG